MRRLVLLVFALLVAVGAGVFLFMNVDRIERAISGPPARYVVATRDIAAFAVIPRDALGLRTLERGRPAPPGAIIDISDAPQPAVLNMVAGRASPQAIASGEAIQFQNLAPFELLQSTRGQLILLAQAPLEEGERLEPSKFRTAFRETAVIPPGAVTGRVGDRPETIIGRLPPAWMRQAVGEQQPLVFSALTFEDPAERRAAPPSEAPAPEAPAPVAPPEPLPADGSVPRAPVAEILRRLAVTPEAARVGVGRRAESEVQAVAGYDGPVDVFLSPARSAMRARGVEEHRRVIRGARLSVHPGDETGDEGPLMWVMTDAETAARIAGLRRQGALVTVVPRGAPLPSEAGVPVLCTTPEVCYRGLTEADEAPAAPSASAPDAVAPEVPALPAGPGAPQGGGPWRGPPAVVR
jgi:Flp pilus assembly protein CpaB